MYPRSELSRQKQNIDPGKFKLHRFTSNQCRYCTSQATDHYGWNGQSFLGPASHDDLLGVQYLPFDANRCSLRGLMFCFCLLRLDLAVTGRSGWKLRNADTVTMGRPWRALLYLSPFFHNSKTHSEAVVVGVCFCWQVGRHTRRLITESWRRYYVLRPKRLYWRLHRKVGGLLPLDRE